MGVCVFVRASWSVWFLLLLLMLWLLCIAIRWKCLFRFVFFALTSSFFPTLHVRIFAALEFFKWNTFQFSIWPLLVLNSGKMDARSENTFMLISDFRRFLSNLISVNCSIMKFHSSHFLLFFRYVCFFGIMTTCHQIFFINIHFVCFSARGGQVCHHRIHTFFFIILQLIKVFLVPAWSFVLYS